MKHDDDEPIRLRTALRLLGQPYREDNVRRLRQRLRWHEREHGLQLLSGEHGVPLKVSMRTLRKYVPELFEDRDTFGEKRLINRLCRALKKPRTGE